MIKMSISDRDLDLLPDDIRQNILKDPEILFKLKNDEFLETFSKICDHFRVITRAILPEKSIHEVSKQDLRNSKKLFLIINILFDSLKAIISRSDYSKLVAELLTRSNFSSMIGCLAISFIAFDEGLITSEESQTFELKQLFKKMFSIKKIEDFWRKTTVKATIDIVKQRSNLLAEKENWMIVFGNSPIWRYLIYHINDEDLHQYVYDLFPGTVQLLENFMPENQLVGLRCLNRFLIHRHPTNQNEEFNCYFILRANGYDELIWLKLRTMLYDPDTTIFDDLMQNLHIFLNEQLKTKSNTTTKSTTFTAQPSLFFMMTLESDEKCDEIYSQLLDNLIRLRSEHFILIQKYFAAIKTYILPLLKCGLLRFASDTFRTLEMILVNATMSRPPQYRTIDSALSMLNDFLAYIDCELSTSETSRIMSILFELSIKIRHNHHHHGSNSDLDRHQANCEIQVISILNMLCQNSNVKQSVHLFCKQTKISNCVMQELRDCCTFLLEFVEQNCYD